MRSTVNAVPAAAFNNSFVGGFPGGGAQSEYEDDDSYQ